ncbi:MAG: HAAS signaling domain-containing protein [Acidimicrobiales bacterium]
MTIRHRTDGIVERYLGELDAALRGLSPEMRRQMVEDVAGHIAEGRARLDPLDEVGLRSLLDRVGDPEVIAAEAGSGIPPRLERRLDAWVPWLLLFGGIVGYIIGGAGPAPLALIVGAVGWLGGVVALGTSSTWLMRDKLLGTFVVPGGLLGLFVLVARPVTSIVCTANGGPGRPTIEHCTGGTVLPPAVGVLVFAARRVAPFLTAIHLERVRRGSLRRSPSAQSV